MSSYQPPFSITNKMLMYVSSISEKIGDISHYKDFETYPHLRRSHRIKSVYSSLAIEANSLSLDEVNDVIDGRFVIGSEKDIQEVKNAYQAYEQIGNIDPYSIKDLKDIHGLMTYLLCSESGEFRKGQEGVFDGDKCIFIAPPTRLVPELMVQLFEWMEQNRGVLHPLILSSVFHYEFVFIHPFADGNGRMARLWQTVLLSSWKPLFQYLPIESEIQHFQKEYYDVIAKCHVEGSSHLFIEFMLEKIDETLTKIIFQTLKYGYASEYTKKVLKVMEAGIPYTAKDLLELLHLKSKETLRKHYLDPAMEIGRIEMTIPDKPTSRNQRYIKR